MRSIQAAVRIKDAMNKLDSKDFQNVEMYQMEEAVNTAALRFCRRRLPKKESNLSYVEDLEVLLKSVRLSGSDKGLYFKSHKLPDDYLGHSKVTPYCSKDNCKSIPIKSELVEDANTDELLSDYNSSPSFEFEQTFHTLIGNRINQYHNKDFSVSELELSYYKLPQYITFPNTIQLDGSVGKDIKWEFKEDICDLIVEEAIMILSGNIKDYEGMQVAAQTIQQNS